MYWFPTPDPTASNRAFYAMEHKQAEKAFAASQAYTKGVPLGMAHFANDMALLPRLWNKLMGPVVYESAYEISGRVAARERPDAVVSDLRVIFGRGSNMCGCVSQKNGNEE